MFINMYIKYNFNSVTYNLLEHKVFVVQTSYMNRLARDIRRMWLFRENFEELTISWLYYFLKKFWPHWWYVGVLLVGLGDLLLSFPAPKADDDFICLVIILFFRPQLAMLGVICLVLRNYSWLWVLYGMLGIEPGSAAWKARTLFLVASLQPQHLIILKDRLTFGHPPQSLTCWAITWLWYQALSHPAGILLIRGSKKLSDF